MSKIAKEFEKNMEYIRKQFNTLKERILIHTDMLDLLPFRQWEIVSQWDLGGDGKCYFHGDATDEWYIKLMRK